MVGSRAAWEGILATDFYQLTAAQSYWMSGLADREAQFDYFFRSPPDYGTHMAGYCVTAGLQWLLDWMTRARFDDEVLGVVRRQRDDAGQPLFDEGFLDWLAAHGDFSAVRLEAIPEGRVVHPHEPVAVARGPLAMLQILETSLLMHLNHGTLIATKAARVRQAAADGLVMEFGARRAHERAAHAATRAALIGGADFSSNTGTSWQLGMPAKGTHAHALVQAHLADGDSELDAFRAFARSRPDDCVLLVDTIDTLASGVPNAITVFRELRASGHQPVGIRIDSGDLAGLTLDAARMLDDAGFHDAKIVLSNQLDERRIEAIRTRIAREAPHHGLDPVTTRARLAWGVGTALVTSKGAAALDGVFKLTALRRDGTWRPVVKLSENPMKIPTPGPKIVWRLYDRADRALLDLITTEDEDPLAEERITLHPLREDAGSRHVERAAVGRVEILHREVFASGRPTLPDETIERMRERRVKDVSALPASFRELVDPARYEVALSEALFRRKEREVTSIAPDRDVNDDAPTSSEAGAS